MPEAVRGWRLDLVLQGCDNDGDAGDGDSLTTVTPLRGAGNDSDGSAGDGSSLSPHSNDAGADGAHGADGAVGAHNADGTADDSDAGEDALRSEVSKLLLASPRPSNDPETPEMIGGKSKSRLPGRHSPTRTATPGGPPEAETPHSPATTATATATASAAASATATGTDATVTPLAGAEGGSASRPIARAASIKREVRKAPLLPLPVPVPSALTTDVAGAATVNAAAAEGRGGGSAGKRSRATWQVNREVLEREKSLGRQHSLPAPNYWRYHARALSPGQTERAVRAVRAGQEKPTAPATAPSTAPRAKKPCLLVNATCNRRPPRPLSPVTRGTRCSDGTADSLPHGGDGTCTDSTSPESPVGGRASQQGSTDPAADVVADLGAAVLAADCAGAGAWSVQVNAGTAGSRGEDGWGKWGLKVDEREEGEVGEKGEEGVGEEGEVEEGEVTEEGDDSKTAEGHMGGENGEQACAAGGSAEWGNAGWTGNGGQGGEQASAAGGHAKEGRAGWSGYRQEAFDPA
ncbi:unnamed protein product [Closterium sp. Naga37s-1]|nr:unnamed protein product [Closterium sp. Naga37s-1]